MLLFANKFHEVVLDMTKKNLMFEVGDKIVYPGHGVGEVVELDVKKIGVEEHQFFKILLVESGMKILVPVGQAECKGLRKIVDQKTVKDVFKVLRDKKFKIDTQTWNRRFREYSKKIQTGSIFKIAEVVRDLASLGKDKELSDGEKRMLSKAKKLLVSEIAIAKSRTEDKVIDELDSIFPVAV